MCVCQCLIMLISLTSRCLRIVCFTDDLWVWELGLCCHTRRQKRWAGSYLIKLINICLECLTTHTHMHTHTHIRIYIQACSAYCHLMPLSRQANSSYRYGYDEQLIFWHFLQLCAVSLFLSLSLSLFVCVKKIVSCRLSLSNWFNRHFHICSCNCSRKSNWNSKILYNLSVSVSFSPSLSTELRVDPKQELSNQNKSSFACNKRQLRYVRYKERQRDKERERQMYRISYD